MESKIKLVIWDADETLWSGSAYYVDKDAVKIKPGTRSALKELEKRGIISSLCSKNNYADVDVMLKKFEIDKYIKEPQIGWGLKSDAIIGLAKIFNLDYEEMIFIDDDPFQRAEVLFRIPRLKAIELTDPIDILNIEGIQPDDGTEEDKKRVQILKEARDREEAEKNNRERYKDFLKECNINMIVRKVGNGDWPRVVQLLNRTNELNVGGNRYVLEELIKSCEINNDKIIVVELNDKFGDYGLVAESIIDTKNPKVWFVRDLAVSCRTMGRGVGASLVLAILNLAKKEGIKYVQGYVVPTESNWRMQPLFEKRGFYKISDDGKIKRYEFDLDNGEIKSYPDWLNVVSDI